MSRPSQPRAFTLIEILIVVVIVAVLAAIVVPQFTKATQDAVRGSIQSQLQTIFTSIELYRLRNASLLPHEVAGVTFPADAADGSPNWNGWGVLLEEGYLKSPPKNVYVQSRVIVVGTGDPDAEQGVGDPGWHYDDDGSDANSFPGKVFALGYDEETGLLAHEQP